MRDWVGKVVGGEAEDLLRHDKWLCMMFPRLCLLRQFLQDDGALFVSIDDNEESHLRLLLDEVFGARSFLAKLVWKARQYIDSRALTGISTDHEYVLAYAKVPGKVRIRGKERDSSKYSNPDNDPRGPWMSRSMLGLATKEQRPNLHYDLVDPATGVRYPCATNTGWRYSQETMAQKIREERILFPKKKTGRPREKVFLAELQTENTGFPSVIDGIFTAQGSLEIRQILGSQVFPFPKPSGLVMELVRQATQQDSIVLDSFAGSGTTAHAVLRLNKTDGGSRRVILVEMDQEICRTVTRPRLEKVVKGYLPGETNENATEVPGLGGGFRFVTLGETLFDETGNIRSDVRFADLAAHVFFVETGVPLPKRKNGRTPLLGAHNGVAIYLLFNGILGDKTPQGGNVLTRAVLEMLPPHEGPKVVYGTSCRIGPERLRRENITFRQIPYEVKVH